MKGIESKKWSIGWMAETGEWRERLRPNLPWVERNSWVCRMVAQTVLDLIDIRK